MPNNSFWASLVAKMQKAMATHSSTLAWTEEPGRLQSMGSLRQTRLSDFTFMHWRRKWQPTPVFLPGESQGRGSLAVYGVTQSQTWLRWLSSSSSGSDGKESICLQWGRPGFDPWVREIPWRRKWWPTSVFLPGESHAQRSLVGYSPWGHKGSDTTGWLTLSQQPILHLKSVLSAV